jgi:predicted dehydrogenase
VSDPPIRLLLAGCGRIAADYLAVLRELPGLQPVAAVDPDPAARARASAAGLAVEGDLGRALSTHRPRAALVLAPPRAHAPLTRSLLAAGCHVFCEKPLAIGVDEARAMLDAAAAADRTLMMATKFRFVEDVALARRMIEDGVVGKVAFYHNAFCARVDMRERWNSRAEIAGGGVLIDNGTHAVDLARHLLGPIARVSASLGPRVQPIDVEDSAVLLFESRAGALGRIEVSWSLDVPDDHYVEVHGAAGTLRIGWHGSRYRTVRDDAWITFGSGYDKRGAFARQLAHFADVVRGRAEPLVSAVDALVSVLVVDAAYRAAREHRWEEVPEEPRAEVAR